MNGELISEFSKNRAEEFPADVWNKYISPPNYENINLFNYDKAVMVEGGRGSGKTSFLRFHCHDTRFSLRRSNVPLEELNKIGFYFRPDTHFCTIIKKEVFGDLWQKIFGNYLLLNILGEFSMLLSNIENCDFEKQIDWTKDGLNSLKLPENFNKRFKTNILKFSDLSRFSETELENLLDWINDSSYDKPVFPDPRSVIESLIRKINQSSSILKESRFTIYIDEFENLTKDQQKLVNTWIKHGSDGLVFSAAYKKFGRITRDTLGDEQVVLRNDYRKIDIEDFSKDEFSTLSAEILLLKLGKYNKPNNFDYKIFLENISNFNIKENTSFKKLTLEFARDFFPKESYEDVSRKIFSDSSLKKRLTDFLIKPSLEGANISPNAYIDEIYPVESIINGALLNRKSQDPKEILRQFQLLKVNLKNNFYNHYKDLTVGVILWIYLSLGRRVVPIYSGFDRICLISQHNIRHFLEICHQCLVEDNKSNNSSELFCIPINTQALAIRKNSESEVEKVAELGVYGNSLRFIVNRLGLFFQLLQRRKSQSEPEIIHFSIRVSSAEEQLSEKSKLLLDELKLWQVLIEYKGDTKRKSPLDITTNEYMLHPVFSANFTITYRKIRKHIFSIDDIEKLFCGSQEDFISICQPYIKKNADNLKEINTLEELQGSLFDDF